MKFLSLLSLLVFIYSCQSNSNKPIPPRFEQRSLETHFKTKNLNILILWDQRIKQVEDEINFTTAIKDQLNNFLQNYKTRILISGIDGNPPYFFLSSNGSNLPSDYSSMFYRVDKLDLNIFDHRYNPNISILKSIKEMMINFTTKKFFIPENDFMVFILTTKDDENYLADMSGQKYQDLIDEDINQLLNINGSTWVIGEGEKRNFTFTQLRLFVAGPRTSCHKAFSPAEHLFYAASKINAHYSDKPDLWQKQLENYNLCNLNIKAYFQSANAMIENRYETPLNERELIPSYK